MMGRIGLAVPYYFASLPIPLPTKRGIVVKGLPSRQLLGIAFAPIAFRAAKRRDGAVGRYPCAGDDQYSSINRSTKLITFLFFIPAPAKSHWRKESLCFDGF